MAPGEITLVISLGFSSGVCFHRRGTRLTLIFLRASHQVTYETIPRKEKAKRSMVGMNELSWSLQLDEHQLSAWHDGRREIVAGASRHSRIGMLLDYEAGTLTYYGDGQTRLHAFHCAFSRELFPACWIGEGVSVTLCSP